MHILGILTGSCIVLVVVSDAVGTLIVTQGRSALWRPTRIWYATTWRTTRAVAGRLPFEPAESALGVYPAVSLLGLLVLWLAGLMFGWALIYWGIDTTIAGTHDFGTILYYSGTALLTPAFGTAHGPAQRTLTLIETLTGLGTIALHISYLPALYGAYSRRETRLLTLDDPLGARITPVRVIAVHSGDGDLDLLFRFFAEWETWIAEVSGKPRLISDAGPVPFAASRPILDHRSWSRHRRRHTHLRMRRWSRAARALLRLPPRPTSRHRDRGPSPCPNGRARRLVDARQLRHPMGHPARTRAPTQGQTASMGAAQGSSHLPRKQAPGVDGLPCRSTRVLGSLGRGDCRARSCTVDRRSTCPNQSEAKR